ncbi:unnamed protein product [Phytophthora lilii]|uniref:Unnamed protein product n=1 Tax=Phytophthora lilii TaxID=2077276 RepID=A0A9W6TGD6_9STRA|nr:unnamed protein product [Phytophthora lilii]
MTDAAFLEEVEDFLVSFDLPMFPVFQPLADSEKSVAASPVDTVLTATEASKAVTCTAGRGRKKTQPALDAATKLELERAKDRKRRSTYRERRRVEKETLQQQVGELSAELAELQKAKQTERSLAPAAWEMVAKRQLQARVNAEEKQRRLLQAIDARAAIIQEFQGVLRVCATEVNTVSDAPYKQKRIRVEPSDVEIYKAYLQDMDALYAKTDEALAKYGLDSTDATWSAPRKQWAEDGNTGYFVYTDKYVMPFAYEQISKVSWGVAQMHHRQEDREEFDGVENPENTSAFKFRVSTILNSGRKTSVLQRAVVRRYLEEGRSIIAWRSFTEGEGMFTGMHADEYGWCITVPVPDSPEPSALIRTMMRSVPMHFSSKHVRESDAKQFTGLVLDSGTEDATEIASRLERLLLADKKEN